MKRLIPILFFFLFSLNIHAQETNRFQYLELHIMPLTLADYSPRLRLGMEYNAPDKISYNLDVGFGNSSLNSGRLRGLVTHKNYNFFEVRPEIKYNLFENRYIGFYGSFEAFFLATSNTFENSYYYREEIPGTVNFDNARYEKEKYGGHLKLGFSMLAFERITWDFYLGFGAARRSISYSNVVNPIYNDEWHFEEWFPQTYRYEGDTYIFHMTLGWKMGILIWKNGY